MSVGLAVVVVSFAGASQRRSKKASREPVAGDEAQAFVWQNFLLKNAPEPTFRFAVGHQHTATGCYGYMYITRQEIRYEVKSPEKDSDHGFRYPRVSLTEARQWRLMGSSLPEAEFKFARGGTYHFFRVRESMMEDPDLGSRKFRWEDVVSWEPLVEAAHFDRALESANQGLAAERAKIPPTASLRAEPSTLERGHPVTLTWTTENALSVDLQPGFGTVAASGSASVTPSETTTYVLTASSRGGTKMATVQVTVTQPSSPPTIVLVEPSASAGRTIEVTTATLKIRGVAMDSTGFPIVSINGSPANMKPENAQAAEFWSDPVALQPGENKFEIVAANRAQIQAKLAFVALYTPPAPPPAAAPPPNPKALDKQDILDLLKNFVPSARLADLINQYGLKFAPSEDDLRDIRNAGGSDDLLDAIRESAKKQKQ